MNEEAPEQVLDWFLRFFGQLIADREGHRHTLALPTAYCLTRSTKARMAHTKPAETVDETVNPSV